MPRVSRESSLSILREEIHSNILALANNFYELQCPPATERMVLVLLSTLEDFCERAIAAGAGSRRMDGHL
jgi:hypothetical protein